MFRVMDETEIEIKKIDKLRMVHIYQLTGEESQDTGSGCTAMAVYYGDNKQLNLSELHPHFDVFVNTVIELYAHSDHPEAIIMDDNTKALMTAGVKTTVETGLERFYKMDGSNAPQVPIESALSKRFLPLAEYLLVGFYKTLGATLEITTREAGWRGIGRLTGFIDKEKKTFRVQVSSVNGRETSLRIGGFLGESRSLLVNIVTSDKGVELSFDSKANDFYGTGYFDFGEESMKESYELFYQGRQVFFDEKETPATRESLTEAEEELFQESTGRKVVYRLPWHSCYCLSVNSTETAGLKQEECRSAYYYEDAGYVEIDGWTVLHSSANHTSVSTKQFFLQRLRLREERMQTYFGEAAGNSIGYYREKLAGKYFVCPIHQSEGEN